MKIDININMRIYIKIFMNTSINFHYSFGNIYIEIDMNIIYEHLDDGLDVNSDDDLDGTSYEHS